MRDVVDEGDWRVYVYSAQEYFYLFAGGRKSRQSEFFRNDIGGAEIGCSK